LDVFRVKYGIWKVAAYDHDAAQQFERAGVSALTAAVLCSRGYDTPEKAAAFLRADCVLSDPNALPDMPKAVARIRQAIAHGEKIAVYGDYDVDGITSTCLLICFLRELGADCTWYIPGRIEEGYGLNTTAIQQLAEQGVSLIVTVDCGITAEEEALFCQDLGIDLIITDHHECRDELPSAVAVVDPQRRDYHHDGPQLAGVGVAFKLAAALDGDQERVLARYCDLLCLGTVADVMPLVGENRYFTALGITAMQSPIRIGLRALMQECGCSKKQITAGTVGYLLAPRINAAGRMGRVELAVELFLTDDPVRAAALAAELCQLNRQRQEVEAEIYADAVARLRTMPQLPEAIVMAGDTWYQGVVGIVASRLAEDYARPVFLICLDGDKGKASSRSYGGFPLYSSLETLSDLLDGFGGHELAAGFTIRRDKIDAFRTAVCSMAAAYRQNSEPAALQIDCEVTPDMLTQSNVEQLDQLEPCGAGCPRPLFFLRGVTVEQLSEVGGSKHLKLRLRHGRYAFNGIFFSMNRQRSAISEGDSVEIAFSPQINEYRGYRSVQLCLTDIRPDEKTRARNDRERRLYERYLRGEGLSQEEVHTLLPPRSDFVAVWRYLVARSKKGSLTEDCACLSRQIARFAGTSPSLLRTKICLDVFSERGLIQMQQRQHNLHITLTAGTEKVNLEHSQILIRLNKYKAGE
jgi:single-stranded-DNA-specific exonuclease